MDFSLTAAADNTAALLRRKVPSDVRVICDTVGMAPSKSRPSYFGDYEYENVRYVKERVYATPRERILDVLRSLLNEFRPAYRREIAKRGSSGLSGPAIWVPAFRALEEEVLSASSAQRLVPRNLVFASIGKPSLVFTDVVQGIVGDVSDNALVYTFPANTSVLTYGELSEWWNARGEDEPLPARLYRSRGSETEGKVFKFYEDKFSPRDPHERAKYPALLPQVWLHFDPLTLHGRKGEKVLPRQRMDYMMLLSTGPVIIEVDGPEHIRDMDAYSKMMAADRALALLGYRVFRIAVNELDRADHEDMLGSLFGPLLSEHVSGKIGCR